MRCPFCQVSLSAPAHFCGNCGHPLPESEDEPYEGETLAACSAVSESKTLEVQCVSEKSARASTLLPAPVIETQSSEHEDSLDTLSQNAPMPQIVSAKDQQPVHVLVVPKRVESKAPAISQFQSAKADLALGDGAQTSLPQFAEFQKEPRMTEDGLVFSETAWFKDGVSQKALAENELSGSNTLMARYQKENQSLEPAEQKAFSLKDSVQPFGSEHRFGEEILDLDHHEALGRARSDGWMKVMAALAVVGFGLAIWWVLS